MTIEEIDVYSKPRSEVPLIVGKRYRDQLVVLYYALDALNGPAYNPVWYRVWGGYVHSAYLQLVKMRFNETLDSTVEGGQLCEVTVPYTDAYRYDRYQGWQDQYRLYYETTHWVTSLLEEGPDGELWYQITNELDSYLKYYAPATHLRPVPDQEISPLSPEVPAEEKRIEVSIFEQKLIAYEGDREVFNTKISSGIHSDRPTSNGIPTPHPPRRVPHPVQIPLQTHGIPTRKQWRHGRLLSAWGPLDVFLYPRNRRVFSWHLLAKQLRCPDEPRLCQYAPCRRQMALPLVYTHLGSACKRPLYLGSTWVRYSGASLLTSQVSCQLKIPAEAHRFYYPVVERPEGQFELRAVRHSWR